MRSRTWHNLRSVRDEGMAVCSRLVVFAVRLVALDAGARQFPLCRGSGGLVLGPRGIIKTLGTFDVVTFWATIEHLPDPGAMLRHIFDILKPGGRLFLDTGIGAVSRQLTELTSTARSHTPSTARSPSPSAARSHSPSTA